MEAMHKKKPVKTAREIEAEKWDLFEPDDMFEPEDPFEPDDFSVDNIGLPETPKKPITTTHRKRFMALYKKLKQPRGKNRKKDIASYQKLLQKYTYHKLPDGKKISSERLQGLLKGLNKGATKAARKLLFSPAKGRKKRMSVPGAKSKPLAQHPRFAKRPKPGKTVSVLGRKDKPRKKVSRSSFVSDIVSATEKAGFKARHKLRVAAKAQKKAAQKEETRRRAMEERRKKQEKKKKEKEQKELKERERKRKEKTAQLAERKRVAMEKKEAKRKVKAAFDKKWQLSAPPGRVWDAATAEWVRAPKLKRRSLPAPVVQKKQKPKRRRSEPTPQKVRRSKRLSIRPKVRKAAPKRRRSSRLSPVDESPILAKRKRKKRRISESPDKPVFQIPKKPGSYLMKDKKKWVKMMKGAKVNKAWVKSWGKKWNLQKSSDKRRVLVDQATKWIRAKGGKV